MTTQTKMSEANQQGGVNLSNLVEFDDHEYLIALNDEESGLKAFVAVHSSSLGQAHGGTRLCEYKNDIEAVKDVLNLSRAMSYKSAVSNLPYGGAKGVIVSNSIKDKSKALEAYANKIEELGGLFKTGTDVGLSDLDIEKMAKLSKNFLGLSTGDKQDYTTSKCAALGVFYSIQASLFYTYGSENLEGKRIGIKGIGKLGGELAIMLHDAGAKLIIADVDKEKVSDFLERLPGSVAVDAAEIHKQELDIYAPCGFGNEFNQKTTQELNCKIISGGANNQLESSHTAKELSELGILYAPDFVVNAGGLIFVSEDLENDGFNKDRVTKRLLSIKDTLASVFDYASKNKQSTNEAAENIARERIARGSK